MADVIPTPKAKTKAGIDPILDSLVKGLKTQAAKEAVERLKGNQVPTMMPPMNEWTGDLFDLDGMAKPFDSKQSNDWFTEATKDFNNPGTTGDLILTTLQVDTLSAMERAFRARHTCGRPRMLCHAMSRKQGHGNDTGPLLRGIIDRLTAIMQEAKAGGG